MHPGYIAALATLFCWTISTFVLARLSRLVNPAVLNKSALFFSTFLLGALVCVIDGLNPLELFTQPTNSNWFWLTVSGILGKSVGDYCGYVSLRILGVRRRSMLTTLGPGFTWLFGLLILAETINWIGVVGMFITITSLLLLINSTTEQNEVRAEKFGLPLKGLLFGVAAAALTGLAFILSKFTIVQGGEESISAFHATWIRIISAFFALIIFDLARNKYTPFITPFIEGKEKARLLFFGILFGAVLGLSFSLIAITKINAAVAYTIFSMLPVTITFISVIFYKKKINFLSWIYSILAVTGVLILVWRDSFSQVLLLLFNPHLSDFIG